MHPFLLLGSSLAPALEGGVGRDETDNTLLIQELSELLACAADLGRAAFLPNLFEV